MDAIRPEVQEQIVRILTELEIYLTKANQLDWIALASIVASFLISIVAICISLKTAKDQKRLLQKQNDIALFSERHEVLKVLMDYVLKISYHINFMDDGKNFYYHLARCCEPGTKEYELLSKIQYLESLVQDVSKDEKQKILRQLTFEEGLMTDYCASRNSQYIDKILNSVSLFSKDIFYEISEFLDACKPITESDNKPKKGEIDKLKTILDDLSKNTFKKMKKQMNII